MRDRHIPRLCRECGAPAARQELSCWSCGAAFRGVTAPPPPTPRPETAGARFDDDGGRPERVPRRVASSP